MIEKLDISDNNRIAKEIVTEYNKYQSLMNKRSLIDKQTLLEFSLFMCILLGMTFLLIQILGYLNIHSPQPIIVLIGASFLLGNIFVIPRILIQVIIFYRTRYSGLIFNLLNESFLVLSNLFIGILYIYLFEQRNFLERFIFIIGSIMIINIVLSVLFRKKGLKSIFNTNTIASYWSTILSQQSLIIHDKMDGYSQRPVFSSIAQLKENFSSNDDFYKEILAYIQFLAKQGEVIGWKRKENSITYFPRVLINYPKGILNLFSSTRLLKQIFFMEDLTSISINLSADEISLFIKLDDYELLNNVTFHLFCQELLERTKNSLDAFIKKDLSLSYSILYPIDPDVKKIIKNIQKEESYANFHAKKGKHRKVDRPKFLIIPAITEMYIAMGIVMVFGLILFVVGIIGVSIVLNVIFLNTDYNHLTISFIVIPIALLFIAGMAAIKAGIDLLEMKVWAYSASFVFFFILLGFLIAIMMPVFILKSDLNGVLIDIAVIIFSLLNIVYLYRIRNRFDSDHSFILKFNKANNKVAK